MSSRFALLADAVKCELVVKVTKSELFFQLLFKPASRTSDMQILNRGAFGANHVVVMFTRHPNREERGLLPNGDSPNQSNLFKLYQKPKNRAGIANIS